MSENLR